MKKCIAACLAGVAGCAVLLSAAGCGVSAKAFGDPDITVQVSETASTATRSISGDLFGIFLEDINYASYIMDDNLLANGSFEGASGHTFNDRWQATAAKNLSQETEGGLFAGPASYAKLTVSAGDYLLNEGHAELPIAVTKGTEYEFSAFIRADDYAGNLKIRVTDVEHDYFSATVSVSKSTEWVKYVVTGKASETATENLDFEIDFESAGTLYLDAVQFETKDATLGIKNYAFNAIKDLHPKFMRFPGGCIIEGKGGEIVYDWKNSVGAVAENGDDVVPTLKFKENRNGTVTEIETRNEEASRKPNTDLWQGTPYYAMEYGIGFYEYFRLCEEIGAKPVPILNCSLGCMGGVGNGGAAYAGRHGNGIKDFIQDAKDLICFANGSVTSTDETEKYWAQVRTDMGHPEPFHMEYLGIGNEQWGSTYYGAYQQFLEAFKADPNPIYKSVTPIVGNGTQFGDCEGVNGLGLARTAMASYKNSGKITDLSEYGIVDHHYYLNYYDFLYYAGENNIYDKYSREEGEKYEVFVGEYSANESATRYIKTGGVFDRNGAAGLKMLAPMNSLITALSEAAYMTALERNGDVVRLAAYAPMFGISDGVTHDDAANHWDVDMMYATNTQLLLTPNYYVQQLFMPNTGTKVLSSKIVYENGGSATTGLESQAAVEVIDRLFAVVSYDEATGDIIVKLVNAGKNDLKVNVDLKGSTVKSSGEVNYLCGDIYAENTLEESPVTPQSEKLSSVSSKFGYTVKAYSANVIRLHTK